MARLRKIRIMDGEWGAYEITPDGIQVDAPTPQLKAELEDILRVSRHNYAYMTEEELFQDLPCQCGGTASWAEDASEEEWRG